jgi:hypothetical protein
VKPVFDLPSQALRSLKKPELRLAPAVSGFLPFLLIPGFPNSDSVACTELLIKPLQTKYTEGYNGQMSKKLVLL